MFKDHAVLRESGELDRKGRTMYTLDASLTYYLESVLGVYFEITVPKGYRTNLASTPRFFWFIFPPFGKYSRAAIVHDFLCENGKCSRFLTDAIFREMMKSLGVPFWKRVTMYYAVRFACILRWRL